MFLKKKVKLCDIHLSYESIFCFYVNNILLPSGTDRISTEIEKNTKIYMIH